MRPNTEEAPQTNNNHAAPPATEQIRWRNAVDADRSALLAIPNFGPDLLAYMGFPAHENTEIAIVEVATITSTGVTRYHAFVRLQHEETAISREVHLDVQNDRLVRVVRLGTAAAEIDALMAELD